MGTPAIFVSSADSDFSQAAKSSVPGNGVSITNCANAGLTADVSAEIMGNSISARVPFGTDVTGLVATFDSTGTRVAAGGRSQVSGLTRTNFSANVT